MSELLRFTSVSFRNYKALRQYSVSLRGFNVLVGPNNSGKSTILGAFRILSEGIRKALARNAELISLRGEETWGYRVPLDDLPVSTENIFSDYDDSQPALVEFRLSNANKLQLVFPEQNACYLICKTVSHRARTVSDFRRNFPVSVGFVPVLGPVEHDEPLYQMEAARRALLTHRAARNFRNIWHHYPEDFDEFRQLVKSTWPGMDIEPPEVDARGGKPILRMFCPEERFAREIYWAGFGFQVWCQLLTFIIRSKNTALLIIDEPDIYLHSDLQRQLVSHLESISSDIIFATHSTEIISEADPGDLLVVNKKTQSAKRIRDPMQIQGVFSALGSNLNPTLTQLAKSKRAVFVEGKDFQILGAFARKLGKQAVATRADFAVIPVEGYNPHKVSDLSKGMELTLGGSLLKAVIFDRDYRSEQEVSSTKAELQKFTILAHIHQRKELENYLLETPAIERALTSQISDHNKRTGDTIRCDEVVHDRLQALSEPMKHKVSAQFQARRTSFERAKTPGLDPATITQRLLDEFEEIWSDWEQRRNVLPGKEFLSTLNRYLQEHYKVTLTPAAIIGAMQADEVSDEMRELIEGLDKFRVQTG
jgi:energy-coupling factor transporter ATP-binding protein EcfA2